MNSIHDRKVVGSNLVSSKILLDGFGDKAMPGLIPAPDSNLFEKIIQVAKWGTHKRGCGFPSLFVLAAMLPMHFHKLVYSLKSRTCSSKNKYKNAYLFSFGI